MNVHVKIVISDTQEQMFGTEVTLAGLLADGYLIDCCTPMAPYIYYTLVLRTDEEEVDPPWKRWTTHND